MGMGAEGCTCALLWSFSSLKEVRPMRKTRHQFHVTMRSRAPSEPWLASNLFVTLPLRLDEGLHRETVLMGIVQDRQALALEPWPPVEIRL